MNYIEQTKCFNCVGEGYVTVNVWVDDIKILPKREQCKFCNGRGWRDWIDWIVRPITFETHV